MDVYDRVRDAAQRAQPLGRTRYLHSSAIISAKGKVLSIGRNHYRGDTIDTDEGPIQKTIHAEVHALYQVNVRRLSGATIVNYACTNANSILSRPCPSCWTILKKLGFKKVLYTVNSIKATLEEPVWKEEFF